MATRNDTLSEVFAQTRKVTKLFADSCNPQVVSNNCRDSSAPEEPEPQKDRQLIIEDGVQVVLTQLGATVEEAKLN